MRRRPGPSSWTPPLRVRAKLGSDERVGFDAWSTLICAGWLPQDGYSAGVGRLSKVERDPNGRLGIAHSVLADHSWALPSPPHDSPGRCGGSSPAVLALPVAGRARGKVESPQRSEENRPCRADGATTTLAANAQRGTGFQGSSTASDQHQLRVHGRLRCSPVPGAYDERRTRPNAHAVAGSLAVREPEPRDSPCPSGAADPPRGDTGVGGARRPRSATAGRGRCRSW